MQGKSFRLKETADFNEIMKTISENRKRKKNRICIAASVF